MLERSAVDVPVVAYVVFYAVLAVLYWPPAVIISWALEDLARIVIKDKTP